MCVRSNESSVNLLAGKEVVAFDLETTAIPPDGGIPERVHIICARELHAGVDYVFGPDPREIAEGVRWLEQWPVLIAHNGLGFDVPVLEHHYGFDISHLQFYDTMVLTRLFFSDIGKSEKSEHEWRRYRKTADLPQSDPFKFTSDMVGSHGLDAWGLRLTPPRPKGTYSDDMKARGLDPWAEWNQEMQDYCITPEQRLLGTDLKWRRADSFGVGDVILGFDEYGSPGRRYKNAIIEKIRYEHRPVYEVVFDNGDKVYTTAEHRWLVKRGDHNGAVGYRWEETQNLRVGHSRVPKLFDVWASDRSYEAGWLAGILDGEGTLYKNHRLSVAQNPGGTLERILAAVGQLSDGCTTQRSVKNNSACQTVNIRGPLAKRISLLGRVRPERLIEKVDFDSFGRVESRNGVRTVVSVSPVGERKIIKIQTSARTFVCEGYPMHNCVQDVDLLSELWRTRLEPRVTERYENAIAIEHYMQSLMLQLKKTGIKFAREDAEKLAVEIEGQQIEFLAKIQEDFPPRLEPVKWTYKPVSQRVTGLMAKYPNNPIYRPRMGELPEGYEREMWGEEFMPKVSRVVNKKIDGVMVPQYRAEKGCPYVKCEMTAFNPNSAPQRQRRLLELGWRPSEFSDADNPVTDEPNLLKIEEEIPAARSIVNYLAAQKRLGMLKTGDKAWLNLIDDNDFLHPTILPCSTVTFRATHIDPNISQVPSIRKDKETQKPLMGLAGKWNYECRSFFTVPEGFEMVGADLSGLELRCWAHYLAPFDNGRMIERLLHEDVHEDNRILLGLADRRKAKEWLFALIYGAGDEQLGYIVDPTASAHAQAARGATDRATFMRNVDGMSDLMGWIRPRARRGWLSGLDGRRIPVRSPHSALNSMLQSAGAIISKYWIMYAIEMLEGEHGFKWGYGPEDDYTLLIYSHDEFDFAARKGKGHIIEDVCMRTAEMAGEALGMRIPIAAEVHPGPKWREENPGQYMSTWAQVH